MNNILQVSNAREPNYFCFPLTKLFSSKHGWNINIYADTLRNTLYCPPEWVGSTFMNCYYLEYGDTRHAIPLNMNIHSEWKYLLNILENLNTEHSPVTIIQTIVAGHAVHEYAAASFENSAYVFLSHFHPDKPTRQFSKGVLQLLMN